MSEPTTLKGRPQMQAALAKRAMLAPAIAKQARPSQASEPRHIAKPAPPEAMPAPPNKRARKRQKRLAQNLRVTKILRERWPEAFPFARPLVVGVHEQLNAAFDDAELAELGFSRYDLSRFLAAWCNREPYKRALARGDRRVHLDGSDAGPAFAEAGADDTRQGETL